ncbi:histone-lysine N-methyltransferase [Pycnococcus provasolii]
MSPAPASSAGADAGPSSSKQERKRRAAAPASLEENKDDLGDDDDDDDDFEEQDQKGKKVAKTPTPQKKKPRTDEQPAANGQKASPGTFPYAARTVRKWFGTKRNGKFFYGTVAEFYPEERWWLVKFEDGDREEYEEHELLEHLYDGPRETKKAPPPQPPSKAKAKAKAKPTAPPPPSAPIAPAPTPTKKRKSAVITDDDDEQQQPQQRGTPKRAAAVKGKEKMAAAASGSGDDDDDEQQPQQRSTPKRAAAKKGKEKLATSLSDDSVAYAACIPLKRSKDVSALSGQGIVDHEHADAGKEVYVCLPQPLDVLTRHHKSCKCAQCQAGTSKGKAKGGGSKIAKAQQQSRTKGDGEAPASVSGMPKVCELASGQGDFIVGSEYDKRLEAEENALGAETVGSHLLGKDWRNLVTYEKRVLFSKQLITDSLLGSAVDTMKKPLVRGCKAENGRLVCLPVDAEAEKEDIDMVTSIQEQYDTELALQTEIEEKRYAKYGGVDPTTGKRMSKRPDLTTRTVLTERGAFMSKVIGAPRGVPHGKSFVSRACLALCGAHTPPIAGIDTMALQGKTKAAVAVSIVMAGGYEDDADAADVFPYTGAGGNDLLHTSRQIYDQRVDAKSDARANAAMAASCELGIPIRVIRGNSNNERKRDDYCYDGLYRVAGCWFEVGFSGYRVVKFRMERMEGQPATTSASVHFKQKAGQTLRKDTKATDRPGLVLADITMGLGKIPIPVVNTLDKSNRYWAPTMIPVKLVPRKDGMPNTVDDISKAIDEKIDAVFSKEKTRMLEGASKSDVVSDEEVRESLRRRIFVYLADSVRSESVPVPKPPYERARDEFLARNPDRDASKFVDAKAFHDNKLKDMNVLGGMNTDVPYSIRRTSASMFASCMFIYESLHEQSEQAVVRNGPTKRLEVYRTEGKGWGVRCWDQIEAGDFVCEFTGEILSNDEAATRCKANDHANEYMFELGSSGVNKLGCLLDPMKHRGELEENVDGFDAERYLARCEAEEKGEEIDEDDDRQIASPSAIRAMLKAGGVSNDEAMTGFELDGLRGGSVARLINTSKEPNLFIQMVCTSENWDIRQARLCLFAMKQIPAMTELTYDYGTLYQTRFEEGDAEEEIKRVGASGGYVQTLQRGSR